MLKTLPKEALLVPETATKVFTGQIFDVYQWQQTMFDASIKTFEMLKRPDTVQIVVVQDDKILTVIDEQPGRSARRHLPGGRTDSHDASWEAAAKRELREETGLVCRNWRLIEVSQPVQKIEWFTPIFLASDITKQLPQQLDPGGERIAFEWRPFDRVRRLVLSGQEPTLSYLIPLFSRINTIDELRRQPVFKGQQTDR